MTTHPAHAASRIRCLSLVLLAMLAPPSRGVEPAKLRSAIGTNLDAVTYWTTAIPFVDVMKSSSAWISGDAGHWDNGRPLDVDADGWIRSLEPGQVARTLTLREIGETYPAGRYVVRYKGHGRLKFEFAARVVSQVPGEMILQVTPQNGGIAMVVEAVDPADPLRDITVTLPGGICEGDPFTHVESARECGSRPFASYADHSRRIVFNPAYLQRLRTYSALRFVNWMQANHSPVSAWAQRSRVSERTWTGANGVPPETMIELANRVDAHPWFTIPHLADDGYVREFARLLKARLKPGLRVYVEHSNEVWNSQFSQSAHVARQAAAQSPSLDALQFHALRSRKLGAVFKEELGQSRVVAVLGAQAGSVWTGSHALEYLRSRFPGAMGIDAIAIAPYFALTPTSNEADRHAAMTLDALFERVRTKSLPAAMATVTAFRRIADGDGLSLIAYEGGQHLVGIQGAENHAALTALFVGFNRDSRIGQLYLDYLAGWKQGGGELFMHYYDIGRYGKWGSWGASEHLQQAAAEAPKYRALQAFAEQNPVWWRR